MPSDLTSALSSLIGSVQQAASSLGSLSSGASVVAGAFNSVVSAAVAGAQALQKSAAAISGLIVGGIGGKPPSPQAGGKAAGGPASGFAEAAASVGKFVAATAAATASLLRLGAAAVPGGLEVMNKTFDYLAATVGQALAPAFVVLLAGVLTVADALASSLKPSAADAKAAFETVVDSAVYVARSFMDAADAFVYGKTWIEEKLRQGANKTAEGITEVGIAGGLVRRSVEGQNDPLSRRLRDQFPDPDDVKKNLREDIARDDATVGAQNCRKMEEAVARIEQRNRPGAMDQFKNQFGAGLLKNLESVIKALQQAQGAGAVTGYGNIADVRQQIQERSFQNDIEARKLRIGTDILNVIKDFVRSMKGEQPVAAPGRG